MTTFHPKLPQLNTIFSSFENIITADTHLKTVFENKPIVAYRRCPTLKDMLVTSNLKPITPNPKPPGFFHCNRKGCSTCTYSTETTTFHSYHQQKTFTIHGHINCNTSNVIYLITCTKCHKQYVGETGRKLKTRITEHLHSIKNHKNTVIGIHFTSTHHSIDHILIHPIESLHNSSNYRKVKELFWINKLQTLDHGLNKKDHQ